MAPHKDLKGGLSFGRQRSRPLDVRAGAGDGHSESSHQKAFVSWARDSARLQTDPDRRDALLWLHSTPNGFPVPQKTPAAFGIINRMRAEGMTKGIPDVRLDYVRRDAAGAIACPGLLLEFKKKKGGRLEPEQAACVEYLRRQGYRVEIVFTWAEAARLVVEYMGLERYAPFRD